MEEIVKNIEFCKSMTSAIDIALLMHNSPEMKSAMQGTTVNAAFAKLRPEKKKEDPVRDMCDMYETRRLEFIQLAQHMATIDMNEKAQVLLLSKLKYLKQYETAALAVIESNSV